MINPLPRPPSGTTPLVQTIRRLIACVQERTVIDGSGLRWFNTGMGMRPILNQPDFASGTAGQRIQRFSISQVSHEYLQCLLVLEDGTIEADTIYNVARPDILRVSVFDGVTRNGERYDYMLGSGGDGQTRTVTYTALTPAGLTAVEEIYPKYQGGDQIYAAAPIGKTPVTFNDVQVEWVDLNNGGRSWRLKRQALQVCIDNALKYQVFEAGTPQS